MSAIAARRPRPSATGSTRQSWLRPLSRIAPMVALVILAAVYLNEYAKESWFTRIINLAVVNLAGVVVPMLKTVSCTLP